MDISPCSTSSSLPYWEGIWSMIFSMKFESCIWQKWHNIDHKVLVNAARSSFNHLYASTDDYEALNQRCISLLTGHHPISCAGRVPKSWYFAWNLTSLFGRNDRVWTTWGIYILPEALPIIIIYWRKVVRNLNSNRCLSSRHIFTFPVQRGYLNYDILLYDTI